MKHNHNHKPTTTTSAAWHIFAMLLLAALLVGPSPVRAGESHPDKTPQFDCTTVTEIPVAECEALVALYDSTNGDNWYWKDGWLQTDTPCSWLGITCNAGHVTKLELDTNGLQGDRKSVVRERV